MRGKDVWGRGRRGSDKLQNQSKNKDKTIQSLHKAAHSYREGNSAQQIVVLKLSLSPGKNASWFEKQIRWGRGVLMTVQNLK